MISPVITIVCRHNQQYWVEILTRKCVNYWRTANLGSHVLRAARGKSTLRSNNLCAMNSKNVHISAENFGRGNASRTRQNHDCCYMQTRFLGSKYAEKIASLFKIPIWRNNTELINVAIANVLQLHAVQRRAVPIRFNSVDNSRFEVAQPIRCRLTALLLMIRYVTLWPWTLTPWPWPLIFDLWPWTSVVCRLYHGQTMYEIWVQSSNPRWNYCS